VRVALATTVLILGLAAATPSVAAQTPNPTKAQVATAIRNAERSRSLWATINICDTKRYPHTLGVRGQMSDLGFPAWLSMRIQVSYYSASQHKFIPIKDTTLVRLGRSSRGLQQGGTRLVFTPHTGLLNAHITFMWKRSGKLLGQTVRRSTAGHRDADFGSPPHFSAKDCQIK
jgi:hypothetical protein